MVTIQLYTQPGLPLSDLERQALDFNEVKAVEEFFAIKRAVSLLIAMLLIDVLFYCFLPSMIVWYMIGFGCIVAFIGWQVIYSSAKNFALQWYQNYCGYWLKINLDTIYSEPVENEDNLPVSFNLDTLKEIEGKSSKTLTMVQVNAYLFAVKNGILIHDFGLDAKTYDAIRTANNAKDIIKLLGEKGFDVTYARYNNLVLIEKRLNYFLKKKLKDVGV